MGIRIKVIFYTNLFDGIFHSWQITKDIILIIFRFFFFQNWLDCRTQATECSTYLDTVGDIAGDIAL